MKKKSYPIKHDFLFSGSGKEIRPLPLTELNRTHCEIALSILLSLKTEEDLKTLLTEKQVLLIDDLGSIKNPECERYKNFIISCFCEMIASLGYSVYL